LDSFDKISKVKFTGTFGDKILDAPDFQIVDSENQFLKFRVCSVYDASEKKNVVLGIYMYYQEDYLRSPLHGPVLMSKESFDDLCDYVAERLAKKPSRTPPTRGGDCSSH
jgi:hypothetical protein